MSEAQKQPMVAHPTDEAILLQFATASADNQRDYMLRVGRGIQALCEHDKSRAQPLTLDEARQIVASSDPGALSGPSRDLVLVQFVERSLRKKWGLA